MRKCGKINVAYMVSMYQQGGYEILRDCFQLGTYPTLHSGFRTQTPQSYAAQ